MADKVTIETINNGYLVSFGEGKRTSYQVGARDNQVQKMIKEILDHFAEKGFRLVTDEDAVQMMKHRQSVTD